MTIRNIDVMNSLLPVCHTVDELGYGSEECLCPNCRSKSKGRKHSESELNFVFAMANQLIDAQKLLEMLSPEYVARFEEYEVDYDDVMQVIGHALEFPQQLCDSLEIVHGHFEDLWEMCEAEVAQYLLMTHPGDHSDLATIEIRFNGGDCDACGTVCRATAESTRS